MDEINRLIASVTDEAGVDVEEAYEAVIAGNTTMHYLACGIDPSPLGKYPYTE